MPQLDHLSFFSQISFFYLFFLLFLFIFSIYVLPKLYAILYIRKEK